MITAVLPMVSSRLCLALRVMSREGSAKFMQRFGL